jgi:hypothetical protein
VQVHEIDDSVNIGVKFNIILALEQKFPERVKLSIIHKNLMDRRGFWSTVVGHNFDEINQNNRQEQVQQVKQ